MINRVLLVELTPTPQTLILQTKPTYTLVYNAQPYYNTQPQYNPTRANIHPNPSRPYAPVQTTTHQNRPAYSPRPHPNFEARIPGNFTPIAEPLDQLFERLRRAGLIYSVEGKIPTNPISISMQTSVVTIIQVFLDMIPRIVIC